MDNTEKTSEGVKRTGEGKIRRLVEGIPQQIAVGLEGWLRDYADKKLTQGQLMDEKFNTIIRQ